MPLPLRVEILKDFLRGASLRKLSEKYELKQSTVRRLCEKQLREYRVRQDADVKQFLADIDARVEFLLAEAWKTYDLSEKEEDFILRIKALDILNRIIGSKLSIARILAPKETDNTENFRDCVFVTVKSKEEKDKIANQIIDAESFLRVTHEEDGQKRPADVGPDDLGASEGVSDG